VAVVEKHTLNSTNTITLMKYMRRYVVLVRSTRMKWRNQPKILFGGQTVWLQASNSILFGTPKAQNGKIS